MSTSTELAIPEQDSCLKALIPMHAAAATPFERKSIELAAILHQNNDFHYAAKLLEVDYSQVWRMSRSTEFARAQHAIRMDNSLPADKRIPDSWLVDTLWEIASDKVNSSPAERIKATEKLAEISGLVKKDALAVNVNTMPVINLNTQPPAPGSTIPEAPVININPPDGESQP